MAWAKTSRQSRGYGWQWELLRARVLAAEPLCRHCLAKGIVTEARHVDHIRPRAAGGTDELINLQPLCRPCHEAKSIIDAGGTPKPKLRYDRNGRRC